MGGFWWQKLKQIFIHDPHTTITNEETLHYFSGNSEASASELLENTEEIFSQYYIHGDMFSMFISHYSMLYFLDIDSNY